MVDEEHFLPSLSYPEADASSWFKVCKLIYTAARHTSFFQAYEGQRLFI